MKCSILFTLLLIFSELLYICFSNNFDTQNATISEFPFLATLRFRKTNQQFCAGAIIHSLHIITAAHCVVDQNVKFPDMIVVVGTDEPNGQGEVYKIKILSVHPEFTGNISDKAVLLKNIAVLTLEKEITFKDKQKKVEISTNSVRKNDAAIIAGWGMSTYKSNTPSDPLTKASMTVVDASACSNLVKYVVHDGQLCAFKSKGSGPSPGDLGGPLISSGKVIGIFSYKGKKTDPDLYTSIYESLTFIKSVVNLQ